MKVLQINTVCGIGSTGRIATDIHQVLKEQGHESHLTFGRDEPRNCDASTRIGNNWDTYSHVLLTRLFDKHGFGSKRATRAFLREVDRVNPDVIHLHNVHGYYLNVELLFDYLKAADKPIVWTLHDCWPFTGHCAYFDYVGCEKWKTGCFDCPQSGMYPQSMLLDYSLQNYVRKKAAFTGVKNLTIVTPSKWLAGLVGDSFLADYPVQVINNGIDLSVFKPTASNFLLRNDLQNKYVILGVANVWDRRKGLESLIKMVDELSEDEAMVLVGLTRQQVDVLPKGVLGITRTDSVQELAEIYSAADVFVNPTLEDNFPTTNLESLACGTPVITFDTGGSVEAVDKDTGAVVRKGDVSGLLDEVRRFRERDKVFTEKACVGRSRKLYDKKARFADYVDLYSSVMVK